MAPVALYKLTGSTSTTPSVEQHPKDATYDQGATPAALTITASGNPTPTYQWYSNTSKSNSNGTAISGATGASYTPSTTTAGTVYYYCVATNSEGSASSNVATITVNPVTTYTVQWKVGGNVYTTGNPTTSVASGSKVSTLPSAPNGDAIGSCANTFMGWSTHDLGSGTGKGAPEDLFTTIEGSPNITQNTIFYAVFSDGAGESQWELVTSTSELVAGGTYTIASSSTAKSGKALGTQNENNRLAIDWSSANPTELTLGGNATDGWTFYDATESGYLYAASSSDNYLRTKTNLDDNGKWTIATSGSAATIKAKGTNTRNLLKYNSNSTVFSCYSSGQSAVYLFKKSSGATGYISSCCTASSAIALAASEDTVNLGADGKARVTLTPSVTSGITGGTWSHSTSGGTLSTTTGGAAFTCTFAAAGTYTITSNYDDDSGCPQKATVKIEVKATPIVTLLDVTPPPTIVFDETNCGGNTPLNQKKSVTLQGYNLTADVKATVTGDYKIARISSTELGDYAAEVTLPKTNEGKINATYTTLYIISTPPAGTATATEGKITITTEGGNTLTVDLSTPTVTCAEYTLTFMDQGGKYKEVTQYAGTEVTEPTAPTSVCTEPINYVFDGWAEASVDEGAASYTKVTFPYTMPNNNTTKLYAVYKYVEDGALSNDFNSVDVDKGDLVSGEEYVLTALYSDTEHALSSNLAETGKYQSKDVSVIGVDKDGDTKDDYYQLTTTDKEIIWTLTGNADNGYSFKNASTGTFLTNSNGTLELSETADTKFTISHPVATNWKVDVKLKDDKKYLSGYYKDASSGVLFNLYSSSTLNLYLYKRAVASKYTTSPVCGPYIGLSGDVRITSANGVRVDAYTQIKVSALNLDKNTGGDGGTATAVSIKAESNKAAFKIKRWGTKGDGNDAYSGNGKSWSLATNIQTATYTDSLCITYTPTTYNAFDTATITLTAYRYNGSTPYATNTITVHGHSLPERFVIAAKGTDGWVALPNTLGSNSSATVPNAENINDVVDNTTSPTKLTNAPSTVIYTAAARGDSYKNNSPTGLRFTKDGGQFLQGELSGPKVWLSTTGSQDMQSWTLRTEDFADYEVRLDSDMVKGRYLAYNKDATTERIGHYATYTAIRFLPFEAECTRLLAPANLKVTQVKSSAITLAWDAVAGAIGYAYSTDGGTTWTEMGNVLTYTITGLTAEKAYTIWVKGVVPVGDTDCSYYGTVSATTTNCDDVPQNISYTSDANSITLSWAMSSNTATVQVFSDAEGNTPVGSYTGKTSPCTITGLTKATTYYVKILAGGTCQSALVEVSTERPQLDVVEWYENKIDVEINTDEKISVLLENQVTKGTGTGKVAEDLFFSKYYEAKGDLKMLGIFNGTDHDIDLTNIRIWGAKEDASEWKKEGSTSPNNYVNLGKIKQTILSGEEMILFTVGNYFNGRIDDYTKSEEYPNGYTETSHPDNWYLVGVWGNGAKDTNGNLGLTFSGAYSLALVDVTDAEKPKFIDVIGAGTVSAPAHGGVSGSPTCTMDQNNKAFSATKGEDFEGNEAVISTNSFLLVRKNTVVSGAKAVEHNTEYFKTLGNDYLDSEGIKGEWVGKSVCAETSSTASAVLDSISCSYFDYVSTFDYNGYYTTYDSLTTVTFDNSKRNPDGTLTINIPRLDTLSCRGLKIIASDESGHVLTTKEYRVPIIVYKSTNTADATVFHFSEDTCQTCDVVVRPNIKLQATAKSNGGKVQFRNMMVYAKGNFEIPKGVDFILDNLEMHAKNDTVAYALIDGSLKVSNKITHVKRINSVTKGVAGYHFALPYPCDGTSIRQYNGNSLGKYDVDWVVFYYDGAARAETGTWNEAGTGYNGKSYWRTFPTADFELQPNVAYIIATAGINAGNSLKSVYFPPKASKGYSETTYTEWTPDSKTVAVKAYTGTAAAKHANDRGWNFIGHPYISMFNHQTTGATGTNNDQVKMGYWEGTKYSEIEKVYVNVPQNGVTSYEQDEAANLKMSPFLGYFVQVAGDADAKLTFIKNARNLITSAPMMRTTSVRDEHAEVALKLTAPSGEFDRTTILVDEAYTVDYEINRDLGKMARAKGLPRFYSISMEGLNEKMCYQALPSAVAENNVPLGFYAYEAGTYTIAIDSTRGDLSAVTAVALKVDGNVVHDLLSGPYTFAVSKARSTDNDSFSVSIQRKAQVTTDVNVVGNSDAVAPVVYTQGHRIHIQQLPLTGRLHIIDAVGRTIVDEQLDGCSERQYTLATDGVYVVRVATDSNVFIVKVAIR